MGLDSFSYVSSQPGQHSPEFYPHYSPPSLHSDYNVPIKQEAVSGGPTSDHSGDDSVSQLSAPAYDSAPLQPPATTSDMKSISDVLKSTYGTWDRVRDQLWIPRDPRDWSQDQVSHWLSWAIREFSLGQGPHIDTFITSLSMSGKELCGMSKQEFITRSPQYMGDILWAHLEILQKDVDKENAKVENVPNTFSEPFSHSLSVPEQFPRTYTTLTPLTSASSSEPLAPISSLTQVTQSPGYMTARLYTPESVYTPPPALPAGVATLICVLSPHDDTQ